jgi:hypothetical protein
MVKYLGQYFEGLNKNELKFALWSGSFVGSVRLTCECRVATSNICYRLALFQNFQIFVLVLFFVVVSDTDCRSLSKALWS